MPTTGAASAVVLALLCVPIGLQAYQQQLTYSAGMRTGDMQQTKVQNTKRETARIRLPLRRPTLPLFALPSRLQMRNTRAEGCEPLGHVDRHQRHSG